MSALDSNFLTLLRVHLVSVLKLPKRIIRPNKTNRRSDQRMSSAKLDQFQTSGRPTWAEIDLENLGANFNVIKKRIGAERRIMSVVKANAYGHGAVGCARRLAHEGTHWFGVALPEEGIELRDSGIAQPILSLGGFWDTQASACIQHQLTPVVYRLDMVQALNQAALEAGVVADVHVKIDTGMGRLGIRFDQLSEFVDGEAVKFFRERGYRPTHLHLANSPGVWGHSEGWGNMVRPGGALYGLWRDILPPAAEKPGLAPVMSLYSRITLLKWVPQGETIGYGCTFEASRKSLIATLPVGYDDGYMRGLSNRAHVIVRGTYAPVVGRVSMDFVLIDVTNVEAAEVGDKVTLIGQEGELKIPAEDLAKIAGTLSYEVTCGISERVPRLYV